MPTKDTGCLLTTGIPVYPSFWNWKEGVYLLVVPWEVIESFCLKKLLTSKMNRWKDSKEGIFSFVKVAIWYVAHGKTRSLFTCYQLYLRVWRLVKWRGGSGQKKEFDTPKIDPAAQFKYGRSWSRWSRDCPLFHAYERQYLVLQNFLSYAWSSRTQCTHHVPGSWPPRCQPWWLQRVTCGTVHWRKFFASGHLVMECTWCSF